MQKYRTVCRFVSLIAYGLSLLAFHFAEPIAAKAYNDLCSSQGINFHPSEPVKFLFMGLVVFAIPLFLTSSNALILANVALASMTALIVSGLLITAGDIPYECFTQAGTYEDHTSGLDGTEMWLLFAICLSYVFLAIDLIIWCTRKLLAFAASRQAGTLR